MKIIERILLILVLGVCCSIVVFAQSDKDGKKKEIPKPNPPIVIVNLDKKDDKEKPRGKEDKRPQGYILGIIKESIID
jgi:hypothetical protein